MSLLPSRLHVSSSPAEPKVLDIETDEAAEAFNVLGSETAREVVSTVYAEPKTPTEIRDAVGTSLQNVHYHLDRLEEAGLIEPAGTGYSAKGNEMTVYGPAREAVVLFAGTQKDSTALGRALTRLFGLLLVVGVSTLMFATVHRRLSTDRASTPETEALTSADAPASTDTATGLVTALDPAVAFFMGGCAVVLVLGLWWALSLRLRSQCPSR